MAVPERGQRVNEVDAELVAPTKKRRRGFAAMDPAKQREIASRGGRASHEKGTGHQWSSEAAREAGRKGGLASQGRREPQAPSSGEGTSG